MRELCLMAGGDRALVGVVGEDLEVAEGEMEVAVSGKILMLEIRYSQQAKF